MLTREERVLRVIRGEDVDYLPSQITFADRTRDKAIAESLGLDGPEALEDYLENHLCLTLSLHDKPLFFRNDRDEMNRLGAMGFCGPHWDALAVYDAWGMGVTVDSDGFFPCFSPLRHQGTPEIAAHMPPDVVREALDKPVEEAVAMYRAPDLDRPGLFDDMAKDLADESGDALVIPSGYMGIYERAYHMMGFEEFMAGMVLMPNVIHDLLDLITDYKVEVAKRIVAMGCKVAHHGDDLGTQVGPMMSGGMFREFILPSLKRAWQPYNDAGIPIILHSCGDIIQYIPDLLEIGLRVLEPVQPCMDIARLKSEFGKDLVFWGGIETQRFLAFGTPEQVKENATRVIQTLGKGGGLIIAPSQEVMNDVPLANVKALVETIVEQREIVLEL